MRYLLFALLICLLPLRGWIGDAMATDVALGRLQQQSTINKVAANAHTHWAKARSDIEITAADPASSLQLVQDCAGHGDASGPSTHGDACTTCQACHTVTLTPVATGLVSTFSALARPNNAAVRFASADSVRRHKPPIF